MVPRQSATHRAGSPAESVPALGASGVQERESLLFQNAAFGAVAAKVDGSAVLGDGFSASQPASISPRTAGSRYVVVSSPRAAMWRPPVPTRLPVRTPSPPPRRD